MIIVVVIHAAITATGAVNAAVATATAAAVKQKEYDDQNPNDIVMIKNIAKTIHKYPPFAKMAMYAKIINLK